MAPEQAEKESDGDDDVDDDAVPEKETELLPITFWVKGQYSLKVGGTQKTPILSVELSSFVDLQHR